MNILTFLLTHTSELFFPWQVENLKNTVRNNVKDEELLLTYQDAHEVFPRKLFYLLLTLSGARTHTDARMHSHTRKHDHKLSFIMHPKLYTGSIATHTRHRDQGTAVQPTYVRDSPEVTSANSL